MILEITEDKAQWADRLQELSVEEKGKEWSTNNPRKPFLFPTTKKIVFPAEQIKYRKGLPTIALDIVLGGP